MIQIAIAATLGGLVAALLGFLDSHEPWDWRKFSKSGIAALLSGLTFAYAQQFIGQPDLPKLVLAFLSGAGIDVLSNRAIGAIK